MEKNYKLARRRAFDFTVNCPTTKRIYQFIGSKNGFIDIKEIPYETYNWLLNATTTITDGELVLVEDADKEEIARTMYEEDVKKIEANTHTREEIKKILEGNTNSMKKQLEMITIPEEVRFVIEVAKDIKIDSVAKVEFLKSWAKVDDIFDAE